VLAVVGALVRARLGRPVLFRQERAGLGGRPFELVKFRTMRDTRSSDGRLLPDEERLTRLGSWLRSASLDELPELVHVVRGQMSLVGPRPLPTAYLERYSPEQNRRHEVRPGITGWSQVNGRNSTTWAERLAMDVWYVDHCSTVLDLRILGRTVGQVIGRRGISHEGHATMAEFLGDATTAEFLGDER
jgi:lipopolysaccharide/colanic/teichoic acid biosynthesis glycosyltransferase